MDGDDAIAIVGIGCRFPGANNVDEYWQLLLNGECHVTDIPKERFNVDAIYDENPDAPGKSYVRKAGLIENPFHWDHHLFGISENEAAAMDPQQRYVLDCVHMAMEDGGLTKKDLDGTATGVYIAVLVMVHGLAVVTYNNEPTAADGAMNADYQTSTTDEETLLTNYSVTGDSNSIMSARVSYHYNLLGPSMTIDTACSSALVAIHLGSESIKSGESTMAICGGVSSILYPQMFITLSRARMASRTGLCQAFSANADGYARGEGCGIVVLEKLGEALRKEHKIWGTIQTGCNQDGQTTRPITAPSGPQQTKLMQQIYLKHDIDPAEIQYIECHGTGTPVGDPIEVNSLGHFFKPYKVKTAIDKQKRLIGSVKTNIGHLESAAGVAGLIKILLMMKHEKVVPSLHAEHLNSKIDFEDFDFEVAQNIYPWCLQEDFFRMACVNCFGFGGTNSHAVIKMCQTYLSSDLKSHLQQNIQAPLLITFSAQTANSLSQMLKLLKTCSFPENCKLRDISYTSTSRRDHWRFRAAFSIRSHDDFKLKLSEAIDTLNSENVTYINKRKICFVFCGVGTAWTGMCKEMLSNTIFKTTITAIDKHLMVLSGWSILEKINCKEEMSDPMLCHIAIFTCQLGLAAVWESWGIVPEAVIGQSVGEVATAYVAGYLSLEDAVRVIYFRSLVLSHAEGGKMVVIRNCDTHIVETMCQSLNSGRVNIAVYSSPFSCTVSGDADAVDELKYTLEKKVSNRPIFTYIDVKCAYHSHHVEKYAEKLEELLCDIKTQNPKLSVYSTVTGDLASINNFATAKYWVENVKREVKFFHALRNASDEKYLNIFIEIGPKPILRSHVSDIFPKGGCMTLASMHPVGEIETLHQSLTSVYKAGVDIIWKNLRPADSRFVDLPFYQFDTKQLKVESAYRRLKCQGNQKQTDQHPLLTRSTDTSENFSVTVSPKATPFVYNHIIDGAIILPGAFYSEVALELGLQLLSSNIKEMNVSYDIMHFVTIQPETPCNLEIISKHPVDESKLEFFVKHKGKVTASGIVSLRDNNDDDVKITYLPFAKIKSMCGLTMKHDELYHDLEQLGYSYRSPVQVCFNVHFNSSEMVTTIILTDEIKTTSNRYIFHPAVLDGLMHPLLLVFFRNCRRPESTKIFPVRIGKLIMSSQIENKMLCYARNIQVKDNKIFTNFILTSEDGIVIAELREVEQRIVDGSLSWHSIVHEVNWVAIEPRECEEQSLLNTSELLIVSLQDHTLHKLKGIFVDATFLLFNYDTSNDENWTRVKDIIKSTLSKQRYDGIILATGKEHLHLNETLFHSICSSCHIILAVLQILTPNIPLFVLTENTQHIPGVKNKCPNVFGAELLGYAKSARLESEFQIFTIDLQPDVDANIDLLQSLIADILAEKSFYTDFVLADKKVFGYSYIRNKSVNGIQYEMKISQMNMEILTELRSRNHDRLLRPFLLATHLKPNEIGVIIQTHVATSFSISADEKDDNCFLWSEYKEGGFPVIANEIAGTQIHPENTRNIKTKLVGACFPVFCKSRVVVPPECILDLGKLPFYKAGILTCFVHAWGLSKEIKGKRDVCIICKLNALSPETVILSGILRQRKVNSTLIDEEDIIECLTRDENTIVLLTNKFKLSTMKQFCKAETVVGFSDVITDEIKKSLYVGKGGIRIKVVNKTDLFEPETLKSYFPVIRTTIMKHPWILADAIQYLTARRVDFLHKTYDGEVQTQDNLKIHLYPYNIIRQDASYIVVGGLTGLGWEVVKWLAKMGAGQIIPMSRRDSDDETKEKIVNIERMYGVTITSVQCDICHLSNLKEALKKLEKSGCRPVKGIYQGAGILKDGFLATMTREKLDAVLLPKVLGTLNLHFATLHLSIDHFVLHSSIASIIGNPGQTSYSAANAFLDAFAQYRKSENLPCQSINWGALDVGMVGNNTSVKEQLKGMGHTPLDKTMIKMSLTDALLHDQTQVIYASIDMSKSGITIHHERLSKNRGKAESVGKGGKENDSSMFNRVEFREYTEDEGLEKISVVIHSSAAKVLSMQEKDIEKDQSLSELGIESQQATEFIQIVHEKTGCKLPIAFVISPDYKMRDISVFAASQIKDDLSKETEKQIPVLEGSITPIEKMYIEIANQYEQSSFSIDFIMSHIFLEYSVWKEVLRHMTIKTPALRSFLLQDRNKVLYGIEKIIKEPEDSHVYLQKSNCFDAEVKSTFSEFDLSAVPPVRLHLNYKGKETVVRLVFSQVLFDFQGAVFLAREILEVAQTWFYKKTFPPLKVQTRCKIEEHIHRKLNDSSSVLESFWESELRNVCDIISLSPVVGKSFSSDIGVVTKELPKGLQEQMQKLQIDQSKILCCMYGMLLGRITSKTHIQIVINTDIRQHFPEFNVQIRQGTNFIPVILQFPYGSTMKECVDISIEKMKVYEQANLYPYEWIQGLSGFSKEHFRHKFCSRSIHLPLSQSTKKNQVSVKCSPDLLVVPDKMEMALTVTEVLHRGTIELQLSYDKIFIDDRLAETFMNDLENILYAFLENSSSICHHFCPESELQRQRQNLKGQLMEAMVY